MEDFDAPGHGHPRDLTGYLFEKEFAKAERLALDLRYWVETFHDHVAAMYYERVEQRHKYQRARARK